MVFWISLIIWGLTLILSTDYKLIGTHYQTICEILFMTTSSVLLLSTVAFAAYYVGADAEYYSLLEQQEGLKYKVHSAEVRDDFGMINIELANQVQDWNSNLAYHQTFTHDFWWGIYSPNYWDDLDYIPYNLKVENEQPDHIINDTNTLYLNATP